MIQFGTYVIIKIAFYSSCVGMVTDMRTHSKMYEVTVFCLEQDKTTRYGFSKMFEHSKLKPIPTQQYLQFFKGN